MIVHVEVNGTLAIHPKVNICAISRRGLDRFPVHHITTATMTDQKPAQADRVNQRIARGVMTTSLLAQCQSGERPGLHLSGSRKERRIPAAERRGR